MTIKALWLTPNRSHGFTLLETIIAMTILAGALLLLSNSWGGAFRLIDKGKQQHEVSLLLERKLAELDIEFGGKPLTEIPEEREDDFGKDYPNIRWKMISRDFEMPDMTSLMQQGDEKPDPMVASIFSQLGELIGKSVKEVKVSIIVKRGLTTKEYSAVTYFVDYDQVSSMGMPGAPQ